MIKKIITLILAVQITTFTVHAACPVNIISSIETIEQQLKEQLKPITEFVYFTHTPTGLAISIKDELIFDKCGCLNDSGKIFLNIMAQTMKTSGHKWMILCHGTQGETQIERISNTSLKAGTITNYLTDIETCLINQLFPIGFGSIIPTQNPKIKTENLYNRVDFIIEEFKLN